MSQLFWTALGMSPNTTKGDITVRGDSQDVRLPIGSSGEILVVDSSATNGVEWYDIFIRPKIQSGRYLTPFKSGATTGTASLAANTMYVVPITVNHRQTFTAVGFSISAFTYVATTLNVRTGVYADNGGVPGALVAGTTATTAISSTIATQTNFDGTFSQAVSFAPGIYWLVIQSDAPSATSMSTISSQANANFTGVTTLANQEGARIVRTQAYANGLSDPYGSPTFSEASGSPWLGLKAQ